MATDDLVCELEEALKKGLISLPEFLKVRHTDPAGLLISFKIIREVTAEQFKSKALITKLRNLPKTQVR